MCGKYVNLDRRYQAWCPRALSGTLLFITFINYLDKGLEGTFIRFTEGTELGRGGNSPEGRIRIQSDLSVILLSCQAHSNRMKFKRQMSKKKQQHQRQESWIQGDQEKDLVVLMHCRLIMSQHMMQLLKPGNKNTLLGCINKSAESGS